MPLNPRLQALADLVDAGERVADIGTDHAYVPIELVQTSRIAFGIASDIGVGPSENARTNIQAAGLAAQIEVRVGPGLETIELKDSISTVVIAGMGGKLITAILENALRAGKKFQTLILEANINEPLVREWLMEHEYEIIAETIVEDERHVYEIVKAKLTNKQQILTEAQLLFGPKLLEERNSVFENKWRKRLNYLENLAQNLKKAHNSAENIAKLAEINVEMNQIKELFANDTNQGNH